MTASPSVRIAIILFASRLSATRRLSASARCLFKAAKAVSASAVSTCNAFSFLPAAAISRVMPASVDARASSLLISSNWLCADLH